MRQGDAAQNLVDDFRSEFGRSPEFGVRAPGRVNLIGEHTDYNAGLVMPCAIDRDTRVCAARRSDRRVRVFAVDLDARAEFEIDALSRRGDWLDFVQGVVFALAEGSRPVAGLDLAIASEVPRDSGLSSSAALGVALAAAFGAAGDLGLESIDCARVAHRGENGFVGVACGILDQFASALGQRDHALLIDCRSEEVVPIAMPPGRVSLLIAHSGVTRTLVDGAYGQRVSECRAAVEAARSVGLVPQRAPSLRDLSEEGLSELEAVASPIAWRRARHVISENARVRAFRVALEAGDLAVAGSILRAGQRSLRNDFEVSVPELDLLCEIADGLTGVHGSRLTGAGFGGCTLHLVDSAAAEEVAVLLADGFEARMGRRPPVIEARPADGVGRFELA